MIKFDFHSSFNSLKNKIIGNRSRLGIYFGRNRISAVEISGSHILKTASLDMPNLSQSLSGFASAQDSSGWIGAVKGFIEENKFTDRDAVLGLSGKDLFIRGFQMPLLARKEIDSGISFEVRKYLPFRTEDLVFDYQYRLNKGLGKTDVFYVASGRNSFDKYLSLFKDSGIRVRAIESSGLALFRLLWRSGQFDPKQTIMIMTVQDEADLEFSVFSAGFPCFSREIKLSQNPPVPQEREGLSAERLSSEVRVFIDYFKRQFSVNSVDKIIYVSKSADLDLISGLNKNLGLNIQTLDQSADAGLDSLPDLGAFKAYAAALKGQARINLSADLFRRLSRQTVIVPQDKAAIPAVFAGLDFNLFKRPLIFGLILIGLAYASSLPEQMSAAESLRQIKSETQESLPKEFRSLDLKALRAKIGQGRKRLALIKETASSRAYLTPFFNLLPRGVKDGLWIEGLDILLKDKSFVLRVSGAVCSVDAGKDSELVKDFLSGLKKNGDLFAGLDGLEIVSVRADTFGVNKVSVFEISNAKAKI